MNVKFISFNSKDGAPFDGVIADKRFMIRLDDSCTIKILRMNGEKIIMNRIPCHHHDQKNNFEYRMGRVRRTPQGTQNFLDI